MPGPCDNPIAVRFFMSSNLTVQGQRIKDSPQFNFRFDKCKNVHVESVHITAPALSPNTDWIHIENNNGLQIYNSVISNGDDCEPIGSGCYNVDIKNITCGPGHGISDSVPCTNLTLSDVELLPCQGILMKDPFLLECLWRFTNFNNSTSLLLDGGNSSLSLGQ